MRTVTKKVFGAGTREACGGRCRSERMRIGTIKRGCEWRCHWEGRERFAGSSKEEWGLDIFCTQGDQRGARLFIAQRERVTIQEREDTRDSTGQWGW